MLIQYGMTWHIATHATLLIVSDVDGTLLAHDGHFPLPIHEMRAFLQERLAARAAPTVLALASSRSLHELMLLQRLLGLTGPLIAEDGGVIAVERTSGSPSDESSTHVVDRFVIERIGLGTAALRDRLRALDGLSQSMLSDMHADTLAALGFRTPGVVRRAIYSREASVLLDLDHMNDDSREQFVATAATVGVQVKRGGRWCTAVSGADKGRALIRLREVLASRYEREVFVVAIGNEENDVALLSHADLPLIIRNPERDWHPALAAVPGTVALQSVGTAGFLEMFRLIDCYTEVAS